jgi:muramoyltetrapeptide carboxypeptidase
VPRLELEAGVERLRGEGFEINVDPLCFEQHFTYAGSDAPRARSLWEAAVDPEIDVLWMARGGYGATRLLPELERLTVAHGKPMPRKLVVGYSDVTALHEFVRRRWGWATLHAPMPAEANFGEYPPEHWRALIDLIRRRHPGCAWGERPLAWLTEPVDVSGELIGGNISLWAAMTGTPYAPAAARGKLIFFEDVGEKFYRIDRMVTQIRQAGLLDGTAGIVLGDFTNCDDDGVKMVRGPGETRVPLRQQYDWERAVAEIFGGLGVPVARGLPVGHGPNFAPLPLGARYRVGGDGRVELLTWDWIS